MIGRWGTELYFWVFCVFLFVNVFRLEKKTKKKKKERKNVIKLMVVMFWLNQNMNIKLYRFYFVNFVLNSQIVLKIAVIMLHVRFKLY